MANDSEKAYAELLATRVPLGEVVPGFAYFIYARNGGVGIATEIDGDKGETVLGYLLHRKKFDSHYLFVEVDVEHQGTAVPIRLIEGAPPDDDVELLQWLAVREEEHHHEWLAMWNALLPEPLQDDWMTIRCPGTGPRPAPLRRRRLRR